MNAALTRFLSAVFALVVTPLAVAGDVTATVKGGTLKLRGPGSDVSISIDQTGMPPNRFRLVPDVGTTVNGSVMPIQLDKVTRDIQIQHGGGIETYEIADCSIGRDLRATGGKSGALNLVIMTDVDIGRDVNCTSKGASFVLSASGTGIVAHRDAKFRFAGSSPNTLVFTPLVVDRNVHISGSTGVDVIVLGAISSTHGEFVVDMGDGINTFVDTATTEYRRSLRVSGKNGTNTAVILGAIDGDSITRFGTGAGNTMVITATIGGAVRAASRGELTTLTVAPTTTAPYRSIRFDGGELDETVNFGPNLTVTGNVDLRMGNGRCTLNGGSFASAKSLRWKSGIGNDTVALGLTEIARDVRIDVGTADDGIGNHVTLNQTMVHGSAVVTGRFGECFVTLTNVDIDRAMRLDAGKGDLTLTTTAGSFGSLSAFGDAYADSIAMSGLATLTGDVRFALGDGDNAIGIATINCGGDFVVNTGKGNDSISITTPVIGGKTKIDLGAGTNTGP